MDSNFRMCEAVEPGKRDTVKVLQVVGPVAFTDWCSAAMVVFASRAFGSMILNVLFYWLVLQRVLRVSVDSVVLCGFLLCLEGVCRVLFFLNILTEQSSLCVEVIYALLLWFTFKLQLAGGAARSAGWCHYIWQASAVTGKHRVEQKGF